MTAYFDNASTTPVDPRVIDRMRAVWVLMGFGNPASTTHGLGWMASEEVEWARSTVAGPSEPILVRCGPGGH